MSWRECAPDRDCIKCHTAAGPVCSELLLHVQGLHEQGYQILSTGGSYKAIEAAGVAVLHVEEATEFPEMLEGEALIPADLYSHTGCSRQKLTLAAGRVKTLHPGIHGGILARRDKDDHMRAIAQHNINPIDVVCGLVPMQAEAGIASNLH